ncbi:MAG: tRNA (N6-isopentenyl adenosine(37)-C2)-methylthiotransferase MiaB [Candidatus Marinimicrobia bacterium]|nr:tRNA (N6-isopentenyl adenosine(37)-C2)-methylthiotransferase MiaB [Candidatus Neomarinimicrobiota bacterium]
MDKRKVYIETYGCQMNEYDTELLYSILHKDGFDKTDSPENADVILINSCSVREGADNRAISRASQLIYLKNRRKGLRIGIVGCVAQRDKGNLLNKYKGIDIIVGPDSYRNLGKLLKNINGEPVIKTSLSKEETYDDILPFRQTAVSAYVSIMRGCDKFCSFCIVPFVRGRERSRNPENIINEIKKSVESGYREVILLGQNVNSYSYDRIRFPELLDMISDIAGVERIRFTSPHPRDVDDELLEVMRIKKNICKHIHLPIQSGSTRILKLMNRDYSKEEFLDLVDKVKSYIPEIAITTDIIVGFPTETEEDFLDTIDVMERVRFDSAFMFKYSPRPGTKASKMADDVPDSIKSRRLNEIIELQKEHTLLRNKEYIGKIETVLIESTGKKGKGELRGRTDSNKIVVIKDAYDCKIGDFIKVKIFDTAGVSLFGSAL